MGFSELLKNGAAKLSGKSPAQKAAIVVDDDKDNAIVAQFNPSEYRIVERSQYTEETRRKSDTPSVQYTGRPLATLTVKLYFDCDTMLSAANLASGAAAALFGDDSNDITETLERLSDLTIIDGEGHEPPSVEFIWGATDFIGYAESVVTTYLMFDQSGKPLRATVDLTLRGTNGFICEEQSPYQSPDRTKARIMTEDNSIWNIAKNEYGDVREWRRIADANGIMNPLDIPVGEVLRVPSINDR
ncbi:MAG: hypothetical protein II820_07860 [Ruminiclostridium sp.]|nr:hypothetical protein [Ruminiclostridium sp.]